MRNSYIGNTFFDASASAFFLQHVSTETTSSRSEPSAKTGTPTGVYDEKSIPKASVGPDWLKTLAAQAGTSEEDRNTTSQNPLLDIQFECELGGICERGEDSSDPYPVSATLTNGRRVECDFVVSATGVRPNTGIISSDFKASEANTLTGFGWTLGGGHVEYRPSVFVRACSSRLRVWYVR